jgi:hypothetical protein
LSKEYKIRDKSGITGINNFIFWSYSHVAAWDKWLYICLMAMAKLDGQIPDGEMIFVSQRNLAKIFQMSYSTFRGRLERLKKAQLIVIDEKTEKIVLPAPDQAEVDIAIQTKKGLVKSKNGKYFKVFLGFTRIPNALIFAYPELLAGSKYSYAYVKSFDWHEVGTEWHNQKKIARITGLKFFTFRKYLVDLRLASLVFVTRQFGPYKATLAIHYNNPTVKEQTRAIKFKTYLKRNDPEYRHLTLYELNDTFNLGWRSTETVLA